MRTLILSVVILTTATAACADDQTAVIETLGRLLPGQTVDAISPSPIEGVTEVTVGVNVFYVSVDGEYVLRGPLLSANGTNLTESREAEARTRLLRKASDTPTFRYPATPVKHAVTVVTDIDCPYCRKLHNELDGYKEAGIDVTYVMLPRSGKNSASYRKTVSAACAADPEAAITSAMNGESVADATCDHPIDEHMALARRLGVNSTPTLVLDDGRIVLGYRTAKGLQPLLEP